MRFPEFSGEWEKCTIGDFGNVITGNTPPTAEDENYDNGTHLWASPADLGTTKYIESTQTLLSDRGFEKSRSFPANSILVTCIGSTIGKMGMSKTEMASNQQINTIVPVQHDANFVYYAVQSRFPRYLSSIAVQAVPILSKSSFEKLTNYTTARKEQIKIGNLLSLIDERIDTQKKIIEDLKRLKDAICNLNFTSGSSLTLGDIGYFVRGLTYSASDVIDDTAGTAVMRSNNISNGDPVNFEELVWVNKTPNHEQILRDGDILICMANGSSPLVGKASYYVDCGMYSATVGAFCGIYRSYNPLTKWLFQSKHYKKHIQRCIQGGNGAIANIYPEDILAISFNIPSGYERVLNILNSLEDKYLLEQKLLCRYLAVKSHLLAQLFI